MIEKAAVLVAGNDGTALWSLTGLAHCLETETAAAVVFVDNGTALPSTLAVTFSRRPWIWECTRAMLRCSAKLCASP